MSYDHDIGVSGGMTAVNDQQAGPSTASSVSNNQLYALFDKFDAEAFDWEAYEGTYKGRALISRLLHISSLIRLPQPTPSPPVPAALLSLVITALGRTIKQIRSATWDTQLYLRCVALLDSALQLQGKKEGMDIEKTGEDAGVPDMQWVEENIENERRESARLDVELRGYMSNLIKESIRLTYLAFAQLGLKCGSAQHAMKNYSAAREYSTSPQHHLELGLGIVETCLCFNQPLSLPGHLSKLEGTIGRLWPQVDPKTVPRTAENASMTAGDVRENREREAKGAEVRRAVNVKIRVGKGLVALANKEYEKAGREFGEVGEEGGLGDWEGTAISTADVILISALCVLATGDRDRIRRVLLDRTSFRTGLGDNQSWLLDLIRSFVDARYSDVRVILRKAEPLIGLNPFLYAHTFTLVSKIQIRSIVQYVEPFSAVKISTMASAFGADEGWLLSQLEGLVENGSITGKIDLIDRVLSLQASDPRVKMFDNAMKVGARTSAATQAALLNMRFREAGISVDPRPKDTRQSMQMGPTDSIEFGTGIEDGLADTLGVPA